MTTSVSGFDDFVLVCGADDTRGGVFGARIRIPTHEVIEVATAMLRFAHGELSAMAIIDDATCERRLDSGVA